MANVNKTILDGEIRARVDIAYFGNKVVKDVLALLHEVDRDLMTRIEALVEAKKEGYWTTTRLASVLAEVRATVQDSYDLASEEVKAQMVEFAGFESERVTGRLEDVLSPINFSATALSAQKLARIVSSTPIAVGHEGKLLLEEIFTALAAGKEKTIRQAVRMGMVEGDSIRDITRRLTGTSASSYEDGLMAKDYRGAEAMIRTIVNHVSNETAQATYEANTDVVKGVMWVSVLDNRTTIICQSRDGKVYPVDAGPRPPAHVNCRSIVVPILKSWQEMGINARELAAGTRASMNGQVPDKVTYPDWLRANPRYAKEVLGKTRSEAFLAGEVEIEAFVNDKGRILTLDELREAHIL